jgi:hypothetical protein
VPYFATPGLSALLRTQLGLTNPSPNTLPNIARHHPSRQQPGLNTPPPLQTSHRSRGANSTVCVSPVSRRRRRSSERPTGSGRACKAAAQDIRPSSLCFALQDHQPNIPVECLSPRQIAVWRTKKKAYIPYLTSPLAHPFRRAPSTRCPTTGAGNQMTTFTSQQTHFRHTRTQIPASSVSSCEPAVFPYSKPDQTKEFEARNPRADASLLTMSTTRLTIYDLLRITYTYESQALLAGAPPRRSSSSSISSICSVSFSFARPHSLSHLPAPKTNACQRHLRCALSSQLRHLRPA